MRISAKTKMGTSEVLPMAFISSRHHQQTSMRLIRYSSDLPVFLQWSSIKTIWPMLHFTQRPVATSCKNNTCSVFALKMCLYFNFVCVIPHTSDQLNSDGRDMEEVLLSCDIPTDVWVKYDITWSNE